MYLYSAENGQLAYEPNGIVFSSKKKMLVQSYSVQIKREFVRDKSQKVGNIVDEIAKLDDKILKIKIKFHIISIA